MMRTAVMSAARLLRLGPASRSARAVLAAVLLGAVNGPVAAFEPSGPARMTAVALADLPRQGQLTYRLILQGGPFPHEKDGVTFGNYERQLPPARRGYYHEYTVDTPGAFNRGARRIVCGGYRRSAPDACYYTGDHYSSFKQILP